MVQSPVCCSKCHQRGKKEALPPVNYAHAPCFPLPVETHLKAALHTLSRINALPPTSVIVSSCLAEESMSLADSTSLKAPSKPFLALPKVSQVKIVGEDDLALAACSGTEF